MENSARTLDGKKLAAEKLDELHRRVREFAAPPLFVDVVVGEDAVQRAYVKLKGQTASRLGIAFRSEDLPAGAGEGQVIESIRNIARLPNLAGLIVQLPLPAGISRRAVLDAVPPGVDVDCLGGENQRRFYAGGPAPVPPTAAAVVALIDSVPGLPKAPVCAVVGQGELVGKPVAFLLQRRGWRVLTADSSTKDLAALTGQADVVVSGVGQPGLVTAAHVKPGAAVIDAGTAEWGGQLVGDVDAASVSAVAGWLTPVPGGVGPLTVAMLLSNVVDAAERAGIK